MDKKCNVNLVGQHFFYSFLNTMMIRYLGGNNPLTVVFQLCLNHPRDHYFIHVCTNNNYNRHSVKFLLKGISMVWCTHFVSKLEVHVILKVHTHKISFILNSS
jgi:hypothetical protein